MTRVQLEVDIPDNIITKFETGDKLKVLLQDFVASDGIEFLRDVIEEQYEETEQEETKEFHPSPFLSL